MNNAKHVTITSNEELWDVIIVPEASQAIVIFEGHAESYDLSERSGYMACQCTEVVDYFDDLLFEQEYWPLKRGSDKDFVNGRSCIEHNDFLCSYLQDVKTDELIPIKDALFDNDGCLRAYLVLKPKEYALLTDFGFEPTVLPDTDYSVSKYGAELIANALEYAIQQAKDSNGEINPFSSEEGFPDEVLEDAHDAEALVHDFHALADHNGALLIAADWYKQDK